MGAPLMLAAALALMGPSCARAAEARLPAATTGQDKLGDVIPFDVKNYPLSTLPVVLSSGTCAGAPGTSVVRDTLFSAELVFQGAVRKSPARRHALMKDWVKAIGDPGAEVKYKEEVSLADKGRLRWFAVPEALLAFMQMDVQPGDRIMVYAVFVGCTAKEPLFAIDEFEQTQQRDEEAEDLLIWLPPAPVNSGST